MAAIDRALPLPERREWVTPAAIGLLLVIRLIVLGLGAWLLKPRPDWLDPAYQTSTYLLTVFLIGWERDRLQEYHIGWLAVGLILVFKPFQTVLLALWRPDFPPGNPMSFPELPSLIVWGAAIGLTGWLISSRPALKKINTAEMRWFGLGILAGILTAAVCSFATAAQIRMMGTKIPSEALILGVILSSFLPNFLYQMGYAAVSEEPLFRGFLWGWLRRCGWQDWRIWLFQAGLFTLGHIYYITQVPYSFWIVVPLGSLVLGWLVWRSRSIATSMAAHAAVNSLGLAFGYLVSAWLFR